MSINRIKRQGFTLVEVIIATSVIGLITTITVFSFGQATINSRDERRKTDLIEISHALEEYNHINGRYPENISKISPNFMTTVPVNPLPKSEEHRYTYIVNSDGSSYSLYGKLEKSKNYFNVSPAGESIKTTPQNTVPPPRIDTNTSTSFPTNYPPIPHTPTPSIIHPTSILDP